MKREKEADCLSRIEKSRIFGCIIIGYGMERDTTYNKIEYIVTCVSEFATQFNLNMAQAYAYLRRFKAIDFLIDCYDAEHTLSIANAIDDMRDLCRRNGGRIA